LMAGDGIKTYVYKGYLARVTNSIFTDWLFILYKHAQDKKALQTFIHVENNTLQDPFYQQVLKPLIATKQKEFRYSIPVSPDERGKPDKWVRVESLEADNKNGLLILNIEEKDDPHMLRLESQFKAAKATSKQLDGPDCIEGGVFKIKERVRSSAPSAVVWGERKTNSKRF